VTEIGSQAAIDADQVLNRSNGREAAVAEVAKTPLAWAMRIAMHEDINRILSELVAMLRPDYGWQADVLVRLRDAIDSDDLEAAADQFASGDLWGGSGSVHDVTLADSASNARKCGLIIELVDRFALVGITNGAASEMAAIYRRWMAEGVFCRPPA